MEGEYIKEKSTKERGISRCKSVFEREYLRSFWKCGVGEDDIKSWKREDVLWNSLKQINTKEKKGRQIKIRD